MWNYSQPSMPRNTEAGIIKGLYLLEPRGSKELGGFVRLLGSGAILPEVVEAAKILEAEWDVATEVWSATSYSELARDACETERRNKLNPLDERVAATSARACPRRAHHRSVGLCSRLPADDRSLCERPVHCAWHGRFGRSDTRRALRAFFEVDRYHIVIAALDALATEGLLARQVVAKVIDHYGVKRSTPPPWSI